MKVVESNPELAFTTTLLTPEVVRMQMRLYGPASTRIAPVSDSALWQVLRQLRASPVLDPFRIWLVGSRLEANRDGSDADLVLAPRSGFSLSDEVIDHSLFYCR
jgi:hypothetical protein